MCYQIKVYWIILSKLEWHINEYDTHEFGFDKVHNCYKIQKILVILPQCVLVKDSLLKKQNRNQKPIKKHCVTTDNQIKGKTDKNKSKYHGILYMYYGILGSIIEYHIKYNIVIPVSKVP